MGENIPKGLVLGGICLGHALAMSLNNGIEPFKTVDPMYSLASTLSGSSSAGRVHDGMRAESRFLDIIAGVKPPADADELTDLILDYTLLRPEQVVSTNHATVRKLRGTPSMLRSPVN